MNCLLRTLALAAALAPAVAFADDEKPKDKPPPGIDEKTFEIVKKSGALYKDAKSLSVDARVVTTVGDEAKVKCKVTVDLERPNKFALRSRDEKDPDTGPELVCDGKSLFFYARKAKQYTENKAPSELGKVGQRLADPRLAARTGMLFANVLADDPAEQLFEGVTSGKYVGTEKVDGKEAHHMKFKQDAFDWELWVAAEGKPVVLKATTIADTPDGKAVTAETYSNYKVDGEARKDAFTFKPADDAKKVKTMGTARPKDEPPPVR